MLVQEIRKELKKHVDPDYKKSIQRFFKEEIAAYGVRRPEVKKITAQYFQKIKHQPKEEVFRLCEELMASGKMEERGIAFDWAFRYRKQYVPADFKVFKSWLKKYVSNWAACDHSSFILGAFIDRFPEFIPKIKDWSASQNRWFRRAAAVSFIPLLKEKKFLEDVFETADRLLLDKDDLVQKGYGWLLKEASNLYPDDVFQYVMKNKDRMPRTALRYAIEKMPPDWKKKAMARSG
jgi:3-methyladenine DNA glycosylase AlkD